MEVDEYEDDDYGPEHRRHLGRLRTKTQREFVLLTDLFIVGLCYISFFDRLTLCRT